MKLWKNLSLIAAVAILCGSNADARKISTFNSGGADVELRESSQTSNRGDNGELATRVDSVSTVFPRNSVMYAKLPVQSITPLELAGPLVYRLTYFNTSLSPGRISSSAVNDPPLYADDYTGLDYWVLDPNNAGADWDESTIIPLNAPGYNFDGDLSTRAIVEGAGDFTALGSQKFREIAYIGTQAQENHLPVGEAHDIFFAPGSALHQAIEDAQSTNHGTITLASAISHAPDTDIANWRGFNYVFNSKEKLTLNNDPNYDMNVGEMDGAEGSPFSGATNWINNPFAPQLLTISSIPEPSSVVLVGLAGLAGVAMIRRRK